MTLPNDHRLPFRPELWQALRSGFKALDRKLPGTLIFDTEESCTESHER